MTGLLLVALLSVSTCVELSSAYCYEPDTNYGLSTDDGVTVKANKTLQMQRLQEVRVCVSSFAYRLPKTLTRNLCRSTYGYCVYPPSLFVHNMNSMGAKS